MNVRMISGRISRPDFNLRENTVTLIEVTSYATKMMRLHGVEDGWRISCEAKQASRKLGECWWYGRVIWINPRYVEVATDSEVRDTILHEIAHALAGPGSGHGLKWKQIATRIGATPKAKTKGLYVPSRYEATCSYCERKHGRARRTTRRLRCKCNKEAWLTFARRKDGDAKERRQTEQRGAEPQVRITYEAHGLQSESGGDSTEPV